MSKRLGRNYDDPDSRRWWEAAEKAAANRRKLTIPAVNEKKDEQPATKSTQADNPDEEKKDT